MGKSKGTSLFENGLIWFGAAVSVAEIMTGTYFAPIGFEKGLAAIVIGHVLGCFLLFLAGVIGGRTRKSAMETAKMSFGEKGSFLFSVLNFAGTADRSTAPDARLAFDLSGMIRIFCFKNQLCVCSLLTDCGLSVTFEIVFCSLF